VPVKAKSTWDLGKWHYSTNGPEKVLASDPQIKNRLSEKPGQDDRNFFHMAAIALYYSCIVIRVQGISY
jgi:hypothetical protein